MFHNESIEDWIKVLKDQSASQEERDRARDKLWKWWFWDPELWRSPPSKRRFSLHWDYIEEAFGSLDFVELYQVVNDKFKEFCEELPAYSYEGLDKLKEDIDNSAKKGARNLNKQKERQKGIRQRTRGDKELKIREISFEDPIHEDSEETWDERIGEEDKGLDLEVEPDKKPIRKLLEEWSQCKQIPEQEGNKDANLHRVILWAIILRSGLDLYHGQVSQEGIGATVTQAAEEVAATLQRMPPSYQESQREAISKAIEEYDRTKQESERRPKELRIREAIEDILAERGCILASQKFSSLLKERMDREGPIASTKRWLRRRLRNAFPGVCRYMCEIDDAILQALPLT